MEDRNLELLRQYNIKIYNTYRIRGAYIVETDKGLKLLKSLESSKSRVEFENTLLEYLTVQNYPYVDLYMKNSAGEIITEDGAGNRFVLKNWFPGEECNLRNEADIADATTNLALLHSMLREVPLTKEQTEWTTYSDLTEVFDKRNRELKRVRGYIREKRKKNEFEICYLNCYDEFYEQSQQAAEILNNSNYGALMQEAIEHKYICHGNYTYHNVIMINTNQIGYSNWKPSYQTEYLQAADLRGKVNGNMATTNFDKACMGVQVIDLYQYLRKVMEKNEWDIDLGSMILDTYSQVLPVDKDEIKLLYVLLLYPEKFWKITNFYYNGKKSWVPQRNIQKLIGIQEQKEKKKKFMERLEATLD
jgi:Ser/Thr protein kinase RdoA (MazF antagonist)